MQNNKRTRIFTILLLSMLMGLAGATGDIYGNVTDVSGTVISGATVTVVGAGSATSDATGYYNITAQALGNHTVYADASGYYRSMAAVNHFSNTSQNFSLSAPNYTISDVDNIFIDVIAVGAVEVKDEVPTLVDLAMLWIILAVLVSIVALAIVLIMLAPQKIGKAMGRRRT